MDFSLSEEQEAVRELAARIFSDLCPPERLKEVEATDDRFDRRLWEQLAAAGILGIALPEAVGGSGLGFLAAGIVAEEAGRAATGAPVVASMVLGADPIARYGQDEVRRRWVEPMVAGDVVLSAALVELGGDPYAPRTTATRQGEGWRLDGTKSFVPAGMLASAVVVSARTEDQGVGLFVVDTAAAGVTRRPQEATSLQIEAELELDGVVVGAADALVTGPAGTDALTGLIERAEAALCAQVAGACQAAVRLTAQYTTERHQFDKPIATFQAVGQRAADAYIDAEGVRLTAWQAVWRLSEDLPASAEVAVAKFWADDGAQRVVHAAQHLHGGMGVDRDYPLHRYYLLVKHLALTLGGATTSLLRLGEILATEPV
ncbi:MAG: acyl-CoA dehydrogenase family protein [Acidimicrobiales bacterium]|jgi:alkylation response protein AidB-like acyl-CoA dehydrogenase